MSVLKKIGLILGLALLISSCHKYDYDDFSHLGHHDKVEICKDGHTRTVKAKKLKHWIHKGYVPLMDKDGDGFVTEENSCGYPVDCDDTDASINPDATEIPYNGIDEDCDASTPDDDLDRDGFLLADECDDTDAAINPDAAEICDDMIDNNCNGLTDCEETECSSTCIGCELITDILDGYVVSSSPISYEAGDINFAGAVSDILFLNSIIEGNELPLILVVSDYTNVPTANRPLDGTSDYYVGLLGFFIDEEGNGMFFSDGGDGLEDFAIENDQAALCAQALLEFYNANN